MPYALRVNPENFGHTIICIAGELWKGHTTKNMIFRLVKLLVTLYRNKIFLQVWKLLAESE